VEERLTSPKIDRRAYIRARVLEVLGDLDVGINMWLAGGSRNAAGKVFNAVKALLSALVTKNLGKLSSNEWYMKKGYTAPTHSLKGISIDLGKLGYTGIDNWLIRHSYFMITNITASTQASPNIGPGMRCFMTLLP